MTRSHTLTAALCLGLVAAMGLPQTASAYSFLQTPEGTPLRWYTNPVPYYIGPLSDDLPEDQQMEAIFAAFEAWEAVPGMDLRFEFAGTTDLHETGHDGTNVVYFQKSGWPAGSSAIATTQSFAVESGEMVGFDLRINDAAYLFTATDNPSDTNTDLQNALTHEVGHILGLDHSLDAEATMYASTSRGDLEKRSLADDDRAGALFLYGDGEFYPSDEEDPALAGCACSMADQPAEARRGAAWSMALLAGLAWVGRRRRS